MKVPLRWLKEYVDIDDIPLEELVRRLTFAGLEVAKVRYVGVPEPGGASGREPHLAWDREKLLVGAITEVRPHPNADRLVIAVVEYGGPEPEYCVTGAPNLFEYQGKGPLPQPLKAVLALEGAVVFDGHKNDGSLMKLRGRKIRGIYNRSMVCSERELGISDEHEGIIILDPDAPTGMPLQDYMGDIVLDLDLTPNMARCWSIVGVAREVAALFGRELRMPPDDFSPTGPPIEGQAAIRIEKPDLNPRFMLGLLRGVKIGPSPYWMQYRLRLAGMRPINNIVDSTNYVMLELGEPLHAFDYDTLYRRAGGKPPTIITRLPKPGEKLTTLDGEERELDPFTILVCDTAGPLSLAGIMGGLESEVEDTTTNVLLEAASWDFISIRRTMKAQKIDSEAAARFSRGVHPAIAERGLRRCLMLMQQTAGGEIASGVLDEYPRPAPTVEVDLPVGSVGRLLGVDFTAEQIVELLSGLEFRCEVKGDVIHVTVPDHRMDIGSGLIGQFDLIEEIARLYGYDRFEGTQIADELPPQRGNIVLERTEMVRDALVRAGLQEIITYRLTTPEREALLTPPGARSDWPDVEYVRLANPISRDKVVMRHTLLAGMLDVAASNLRYREHVAFFEVGKVFIPCDAPLPDEPLRLGIVMRGPRRPESWLGRPDDDASPMDFYDLKGVIESLVEQLHLPEVTYRPSEHSSFHPGRAAELNVSGRNVGVFGELHPLVCKAFDLGDMPVLAGEFDLETLIGLIPATYKMKPISRYEAIRQDIALIVDEAVPAAEVEAVIWEAGGQLLRGVRLFDVYRGDPIPPGKKNLAYTLMYQSYERTLTTKKASKVHAKIAKALERRLGAKIRA